MGHAKKLSLVLVLALCCAGCGKSSPTLAGGKPVRHWIDALQSPDARIRKQAVFKLGNVGPTDAVAVPALLNALRDRHAAVRKEAILALLKCGPAAAEAVPALTAMRHRDPDAQVRRYAAKAIEKLTS